MSRDFIRLENARYGDTFIVNIRNITFFEGGYVVVINGTHGDGNSLIHITQESGKRLSKMLEERLWSDEE